jgi:hypothetical protein
VLIIGIIDNALKVAFVVAHLKRDGVRHICENKKLERIKGERPCGVLSSVYLGDLLVYLYLVNLSTDCSSGSTFQTDNAGNLCDHSSCA